MSHTNSKRRLALTLAIVPAVAAIFAIRYYVHEMNPARAEKWIVLPNDRGAYFESKDGQMGKSVVFPGRAVRTREVQLDPDGYAEFVTLITTGEYQYVLLAYDDTGQRLFAPYELDLRDAIRDSFYREFFDLSMPNLHRFDIVHLGSRPVVWMTFKGAYLGSILISVDLSQRGDRITNHQLDFPGMISAMAPFGYNGDVFVSGWANEYTEDPSALRMFVAIADIDKLKGTISPGAWNRDTLRDAISEHYRGYWVAEPNAILKIIEVTPEFVRVRVTAGENEEEITFFVGDQRPPDLKNLVTPHTSMP